MGNANINLSDNPAIPDSTKELLQQQQPVQKTR